MPYLAELDRREKLNSDPWQATDPGELNFALTRIILDYLPEQPHYADYNSIVGVLECVKQEFYRRAVAEYENLKCKINGDVGYEDLPQNKGVKTEF